MADIKTSQPRDTFTNSADRPTMTKPSSKPSPKK